jgi:uncharacterized protein (TIGR02569 family)
MKNNPPTKDVLKMFGLVGKPVRIKGGQGNSYRIADTVLKLENYNNEEVEWIARIYKNIKQNGFRLPKQIKTRNGKLIYKQWTAWKYVEGNHSNKKWKEVFEVCDLFHKSLQKINKPKFIEKRKNKWAIADKMVWGELPLKYPAKLKKIIKGMLAVMRPITVLEQVIHGDFGSRNILFTDDGEPPYIIDFSPYYRSAGFAKAITAIDAITWGKANKNIFKYLKNEPEIKQLLIRAIMRRILEEGTNGSAYKYKPLVDYVINKLKLQS